jgi:hypothetical protein
VGDVGGRPSRLGGDPSDQGQPPRGVSRALAWGMRPPVSAVPSASPHLTRRPHLTSTTSMGRTARSRSTRFRSGALTLATCFARSRTRSTFCLALPVYTLTVDPF